MTPIVSVLITTFNRKDLLKRAIESVLTQTFTDLEIIVLDDASTDGTHEIIPKDARIRYYRNEENQGAEHGDRVHIRRFVNELATGKYFIYLCDDDQWIKPDLLERQLHYFKIQLSTAMVIGGQVSNFIPPGNEVFHEQVYPRKFMSSATFLAHFAEHPITSNIIIGATLYNKELFIKSGALSSHEGPKWEAGYEMLMGPGAYGDVVYLDESCVMTEIRPTNASFQGTQLDHYLDCVKSVKAANLPLDIQSKTLHNIAAAFLRNAGHIQQYGALSMCSPTNISRPVTIEDIIYD